MENGHKMMMMMTIYVHLIFWDEELSLLYANIFKPDSLFWWLLSIFWLLYSSAFFRCLLYLVTFSFVTSLIFLRSMKVDYSHIIAHLRDCLLLAIFLHVMSQAHSTQNRVNIRLFLRSNPFLLLNKILHITCN